MKWSYIQWRFMNYHSIPKVRTRSAIARTTKKYQSTERGKEVGRHKSRRYRENKKVFTVEKETQTGVRWGQTVPAKPF